MLIETHDAQRIEAVVIRRHGKYTSICVSSQIGCKMGCQFCATGTMGILGNLTASEMSDNWDAYSMSNDDAVHSESNFNAFRTFLTKALEKKSGTAKSGVAKSIEKKSAVVTKVDNKRKNSQVNPMGSPPSNSKAKLAAGITRVSTSPAAAYEDRKNVGQVVAHFNTQLDEKKVDLNLVTGGR